MRRKTIYLDYAATTPVDKKVLDAMLPFLKGKFGNPSSLHAFGQEAKVAVEKARESVAEFLKCSPLEVLFTSGATEANNLALKGVLLQQKERPHVITSAIEHESVLDVIKELENEGAVEASFIAPNKEGLVSVEDVRRAIKSNTKLISLMYANSEVGSVQPIAEMGKIAGKANVLFHTDAVQAANYLECSVKMLHADLLTLSSHKIYGPKGVGVLYVKEGTPLSAILRGGGQEQDMRSGTENVAGIVGMGEAVAELSNPKHQVRHVALRQLRDRLAKELGKVPGVSVTGTMGNRLPNNVHVVIEGVEGRDMVQLLDRKGIAVSTGSACSERSQSPSHVLLAMGYSEKEALSALRMTLGKETSKDDIATTVKAFKVAVEQLRQAQ